jgi:hypothetical protein
MRFSLPVISSIRRTASQSRSQGGVLQQLLGEGARGVGVLAQGVRQRLQLLALPLVRLLHQLLQAGQQVRLALLHIFQLGAFELHFRPCCAQGALAGEQPDDKQRGARTQRDEQVAQSLGALLAFLRHCAQRVAQVLRVDPDFGGAGFQRLRVDGVLLLLLPRRTASRMTSCACSGVSFSSCILPTPACAAAA